MERSKHIGIPFAYDDKWIGGSYYVLNLIHSLKYLDENDQPLVSVICPNKSQFELVKKETRYPKLSHYSDVLENRYGTIGVRIINKGWRMLTGKNLISTGTKKLDHSFDLMYPRYIGDFEIKKMNKLVWIPDLQEEFLPEFFSERELEARRASRQKIASEYDLVVFSSQQSMKDFKKFHENCKADFRVLPFAVTHPEFDSLDGDKLKQQYGLPENYFFVSNQFWSHKNHIVVLKALQIALKSHPNTFIAFSGKEEDYRNKDYTHGLKSFVSENNLKNHVRFLGFIDRRDQLKLMSESLAVIQPSLFEGWSTVVEDAKSMGQHIFASNLGIHQEQLAEVSNSDLFEPHNEQQLAGLIVKKTKREINVEQRNGYSAKIVTFGREFMKIVEDYTY